MNQILGIATFLVNTDDCSCLLGCTISSQMIPRDHSRAIQIKDKILYFNSCYTYILTFWVTFVSWSSQITTDSHLRWSRMAHMCASPWWCRCVGGVRWGHGELSPEWLSARLAGPSSQASPLGVWSALSPVGTPLGTTQPQTTEIAGRVWSCLYNDNVLNEPWQ